MLTRIRAFVQAHVKITSIFVSQLALGFGPLCAATLTWTGAAGNGNVFTSTNWSPAQAPAAGDTLIFAGSTSLIDTFGASAFSVASLSFSSTAGAFVLNGTNTLTLSSSSGITNSSAATQTINVNLALGTSQTWNASAGALVVNGIVSGNGNLTKSGSSILTLNGANTYTGNTTLSAGTVQIGSDSAFGTGTVTFNNSALRLEAIGGDRTLTNGYTISAATTFQGAYGLTLSGLTNMSKSRTITVNGTGTLFLTGVISGANRSLTKAGTGSLMLSGNNTFGGGYIAKSGTSIIANSASVGSGTLQLGAANFQGSSNALTFSNAVSLIGDTTFAGTPTITFNNTATLTANRIQTTVGTGLVTYNGAVAGAFSFTKSGSSSMAFTGSSANTYSGLTTVTDGTLILGKTAGVNAVAGALTIGDGSGAAGSASVQWNASNQVADLAAITLNTDGVLNLQGNSDTISSISATGGSITGAGTLGLGGNLTFSGTSGAQTTISAGLALNAARTFNIGSNGTSAGDVSISGIVSNGSAVSSLTKTGVGTLTLSGANTFSGGLSNNAGTVLLGSSSALGTAAATLGDTVGSASASFLFNTSSGLTVANAIAVRANTGTMTLGGTNTSGINAFSGAITLSNALTVTADAGGEVDFNGAISGAFAVTKIGAGTIKLNTANPYSGGTVVNSGTLSLGTNNALGNGTVTVNSGTLDFAANNSATVSALTLVDGTLAGSGTSTLTTAGNIGVQNGSISVILAGAGSLVKTTAGTVSLSSSSGFSGTTSVNDGTLAIGKINALPTTTDLTVAGPGTLNLQGFATQIGSLSGAGNVRLGTGNLTVGNSTSTSFSGVISGLGGLIKTGSGVLTLTGANTFTGSTTISQGTVQLGQSSALNPLTALTLTLTSSTYDANNFTSTVGSIAGAGNILDGIATFSFGGDNSSTSFSGVISGSGTITKEGSGTTTLSGVSTHSGNLNLNNGRLILNGAGGSLAASSVMIRSGAILDMDSTTTENNNRIGNSVAITLGGGTLRLLSDSNGTLESVGSLIPAAGSSTVQVIHNGTTANNTRLTFSSLGSVASGANVNFLGTGGVLGGDLFGPQIFITGQALGLLGSWATVGADPAEYSTFGVRAYSDYYEGTLGVNYNSTAKLVRLSVNSLAAAYTLTNSGLTTDLGLNLTDIALVDLGTSATRTLNLSGGSLIKSTATPSTISGLGVLTAGGITSGNLAISVTSGSSLTIASVIANNASASIGLSKSDLGTLTLGSANTFTGNVSLNGGTTVISNESNLGAIANTLVFNGGSLRVTSGFTTSSAKVFSVLSNQTGTLNIDASQSLIMANSPGVLQSGNAMATLVKTGLGTWVLQNANTGFNATLQINQGTLGLRNSQSTLGGITLNGGTLALSANTSTTFSNALSVLADSTIYVDRISGTGAVVQTAGSLSIGANTLTVSGANAADLALGAISLLGNATFNPTTANLSSSAISGNFGFTKTGAGTFSLNAANTYTGATNVSNGTLRLGVASALPSTTDLTVSTGASVDFAGFSGSTASLSGAGNVILGNGTFTTGSTTSTFSGNISGVGGLTKSGSGNLTLSGVNSYSGLTSVTGGTLTMGGVNRLSSNSALNVTSGATFALNNFDTASASLFGAGSVSLGSGILTTGTLSTIFSGAISGTGGLTKTGAGSLTLSGPSTYSGTTNINQGNLVLRHASALGASVGVNLASGAELQLENNITTAAYAFNLGGTLRNNSGSNNFTGATTLTASGNVVSDAGSLTLSGAMALGGNVLTINGSGDSQFLGAISGDGSITKSGVGITTVSGTNIFTGVTTVSAGTLQVRSTSALGATGAANSTRVLSGATLLLSESNGGVMVGAETLELAGTGLGGNGALRSAAGANSWTGPISLVANVSIRVDSGTLELAGALAESGGARLLTKTGAGTLVATALLTQTGGTAISEGSLQLVGNDRLTRDGGVDIASGATLNMDDNDQSIGSLTGSGFVQTGPTPVLTTGGTFTVGTGGGTATFSGSIQGAGDVVKDGAGVQILAGANTFTGSTLVNAGQLEVSANNALGACKDITINSGGTLLLSGSATDRIANSAPMTLAGGTLARSSGSEGTGSSSTGAGTSNVGLGVLTLTANSTLDFGNGAVGTLVFSSFTNSPFTLTINNYTPTTSSTYADGSSDRLIFNSSQSGNLSSFVFANSGPATQISLGSGFYEITPTAVPEPSTWVGAAFLTGGAIATLRRRRSGS